ncbi:hypothetical protein LXA43DRAFT_1107794 [Ganoderma leucocontextum]|nr:hypothetical protein LXA43DRAFT_1107794 [Ganoderma leucocontextum]
MTHERLPWRSRKTSLRYCRVVHQGRASSTSVQVCHIHFPPIKVHPRSGAYQHLFFSYIPRHPPTIPATEMATLTIRSANQPLQSILLNPTTNPIPSTTESIQPPAATPSTPRPVHQTPRPRLTIAIPDEPHRVTGQGSRRPRQRRGGSPPPPPPPPNTPTVRFSEEPHGPSAHRQQRAFQRLSPNGALRPVARPRRHRRANDAIEAENAAHQAHVVEDDGWRTTAELEHAMLTDPYMWSRSSYPANWAEYNDRVQHSEEVW